ncbi:MAG: LptE family protein [Bacteroidota bacterium]|nr:LptE family protein [Bacteroidota bacterium]MDE2955927.1 LptE family protein [Bacteroidota bacterium]
MWTKADSAIVMLLVLLAGCGYYSFSGASIPAHLTTIAIPLAEDRSLSPITVLDESLTEMLVDRFVRQTRLALVEDEDEADIVLTAQITQYNNAPSSVTGQERAQFNRITLSVAAQYHNRVDDDMLERTFSNFDDYDPLEGGLEAEESAALNALGNVADDLFTAATSNW